MSEIRLITDGACKGNPGPGGWAALIKMSEEKELLTGGAPETTNNRMEMTAVIEGLKKIGQQSQRVHIVTDSKYVMDAFEKGWIKGWLANNWRNASKKPVKNKDLWEVLIDLVNTHDVSWEWVKGHAGHPENEVVDHAAQEAAMMY